MDNDHLGRRLLTAFLLIDGAAIFALWTVALARGAFTEGIFHYENGNYPALHLAAELLMGGSALLGGLGLWRGARWGRGLALFSLGALAYSSINSAGWALRHDLAQLLPMAATLVAAALCLPYLLRHQEQP